VPRPPTRRRFLVAYGLWVFGIFAYFVPGATWNPVSRFDLTRSIVEHRTLAIDEIADSTGDRASRDGHSYSDKAPIPSLLALPAYGAFHVVERLRGGSVQYQPVGAEASAGQIRVNRAFQVGLWVCSLSTAALAGAILAVLLFESLRSRTTPMGALVASASVVLATPVFPYATSFYGHTIAALFLFAAFLVAVRDAPSRRSVRAAGACIALAVGCEYLTVVPGIAIAASLVLGRPRSEARSALVDLALGASLPVAVIATYHAICFGAPWRTGYSYLVRPEFVAGHSGGVLGIHMPRLVALVGLLVGPRRGLFFVAPATAVAVVGLALAHRRGDRAARIAVAAALAMFLVNAGYYMWWGGAAAGPRHLVPVLPLLGCGYAVAWGVSWLRVPLVVLGVVSFAAMLSLTAVGLEAPEHGNVLFDYVWPNLVRGRVAQIRGATNVGLLLGLRPLASLGPILLWAIAGFGWLSRDVARFTVVRA
jgi:hypothetical protein